MQCFHGGGGNPKELAKGSPTLFGDGRQKSAFLLDRFSGPTQARSHFQGVWIIIQKMLRWRAYHQRRWKNHAVVNA
jgi:hypothetical protein